MAWPERKAELEADVAKTEGNLDVIGWIMAIRRLHFMANLKPDKIVVGELFYNAICQFFLDRADIGPDVEKDAGEVKFRGIPIVTPEAA